MSTILPFRALRPEPAQAAAVAAVPYDVVDAAEARALAADDPLSFLRVSRPEIELPEDTDPHADIVYATGVRNFARLRAEAPLVQEASAEPVRLPASDGRPRADRRRRVLLGRRVRGRRHPQARTDAQGQGGRPDPAHPRPAGPDRTGLPDLSGLGGRGCGRRANDGRRAALRLHRGRWRPAHRLARRGRRRSRRWSPPSRPSRPCTSPTATIEPRVRCALARRCGSARPASGALEADTFLAVAFPDDQTQVLPYHRVVKDLGGHSPESFLDGLREHVGLAPGTDTPAGAGDVSMYLAGEWYTLHLVPAPDGTAPADRLDVQLLHDQVLRPVARDRRPADGRADRVRRRDPGPGGARRAGRLGRGGRRLRDGARQRRGPDAASPTAAASCRPSPPGSSRNSATAC